MPSKTPGVSQAMIGKPGEVKSWLQIATTPSAMLTNPAMLAGVAGIMSQLVMQHQMAEITDYLATIDEKLDDVLRAQKDTVLAQMIGVGLQIEAAMTIRDHVGRVNDVTWSKIQATSGTIADTQAYALLQLDALADKLEHKQDVGELATATKDAERLAHEWLAVMARCFQLQDAISVLELDRVLETAPNDLDGHRTGLRAARQQRLNAISHTTEQLMARLDAAARTANTKVLMHPTKSRAVVESSNHVGAVVTDFQGRLGIEQERTAGGTSLDGRRDLREGHGAGGGRGGHQYRPSTQRRRERHCGRTGHGRCRHREATRERHPRRHQVGNRQAVRQDLQAHSREERPRLLIAISV